MKVRAIGTAALAAIALLPACEPSPNCPCPPCIDGKCRKDLVPRIVAAAPSARFPRATIVHARRSCGDDCDVDGASVLLRDSYERMKLTSDSDVDVYACNVWGDCGFDRTLLRPSAEWWGAPFEVGGAFLLPDQTSSWLVAPSGEETAELVITLPEGGDTGQPGEACRKSLRLSEGGGPLTGSCTTLVAETGATEGLSYQEYESQDLNCLRNDDPDRSILVSWSDLQSGVGGTLSAFGRDSVPGPGLPAQLGVEPGDWWSAYVDIEDLTPGAAVVLRPVAGEVVSWQCAVFSTKLIVHAQCVSSPEDGRYEPLECEDVTPLTANCAQSPDCSVLCENIGFGMVSCPTPLPDAVDPALAQPVRRVRLPLFEQCLGGVLVHMGVQRMQYPPGSLGECGACSMPIGADSCFGYELLVDEPVGQL